MELAPPAAKSAAIERTRARSFRLMALLTGGALLGKLLGFVRELVMARVFGASLTADSFRGAVTGVLLPLGPLLNEATPAILIPMHRDWQVKRQEAVRLAATCVALGLTAGVLMLLVQIAGPYWVSIIVGRFKPEAQKLVLDFIRIMALMMPAAVVLNCLIAAEIAEGRSRLAALRAAILNAFVTSGILLYSVTGVLSFLPWSFVLSFNALTCWGVWIRRREGALDWTNLRVGTVIAAWREFMIRLRPLIAQPLVEQVHGWVERLVASGFAVGTMASLDYARTLTDSASVLVSQPVGLAVLYKGASPRPREQVQAIARPLLAVALPASLYLAMFSQDIVRLIFERGAFDATAVAFTSASLRGIAFGLWASTLGMILLRLLNSSGRNVQAALIMAVAFGANAAMSLLTARIVGLGGHGSTLLGLGEAVRGIVLLWRVSASHLTVVGL